MRITYQIYIILLIITIGFSSCKSNDAAKSTSSIQDADSQYNITNTFIEAKRKLYQGNQAAAFDGFNKCIKMNPKHDASYFELARMYEHKDPEKSIEYIKKAIEIDNSNIWYKEFLLRVYQQQKEYDNAIEIIKELIKLQPESKEYYYQWANLSINNKDYNQAIIAYDKILDSFSYEEGVVNQKKQIYLKKGNYKKAIEVLELQIEHQPKNKEYYGMIAEIYLNMGNKDKAMEYYQKILEIDPNDGFVHFALADYYRSLGQTDKAMAELRLGMSSKTLAVDNKMKVLLRLLEMTSADSSLTPEFEELLAIAYNTHPKSPKILALEADYNVGKGNNEEAISFYRQVIAIDSSKFVVWEQLLIIEEKQGDYAAMKNESNRALRIFPQRASLYYFSALAYADEGNWKKVKGRAKMGENFIYNQIDMASFLALRAKAEMQLGESDNSIANYQRAISLDPNNAEIKRDFAFALASHEMKFQEALSYAKQALELNGDNPDYIYVYAYCLFKDGQKEEALKWLEPALIKFPKHKDLQLLDMEINKG